MTSLKEIAPAVESDHQDEEPEKPKEGYGGEAYEKGYGSIDYWDDRYANWATSPYDWIFEWRHVKNLVDLFVNHADLILVPGCGNAPFSGDMFDAGYHNQINIDLSEVAIKVMKEINETTRPALAESSVVMNAVDTCYQDGSFDSVIDKSLIDTTVCMANGKATTRKFVREMCRILKRGGIYITMSLHKWDEIRSYFEQKDHKLGCRLANASIMLENDSDLFTSEEQRKEQSLIEDEKQFQCFVVSMKMPPNSNDADVAKATKLLQESIQDHDQFAEFVDQERRIKEAESRRNRSRIATCLRLIRRGQKEFDFTQADVKFYKEYLMEKSDSRNEESDVGICTSIVASMLCEKMNLKPPQWAKK